MRDPENFTGEEYVFTLYESEVRPGVIVRHKSAPLDHGQWISLDDLVAFVAWREALKGPAAPLVAYRYDMIGASKAGVNEHPELVIRRLAPAAHDLVPESVCDAWFFRAPRIASPPAYLDEAPSYFEVRGY